MHNTDQLRDTKPCTSSDNEQFYLKIAATVARMYENFRQPCYAQPIEARLIPHCKEFCCIAHPKHLDFNSFLGCPLLLAGDQPQITLAVRRVRGKTDDTYLITETLSCPCNFFIQVQGVIHIFTCSRSSASS